jgi:osmotically-inducible protein OsmY
MLRKILPITLASMLMLQGCVGVLLAGSATGGAVVAKDRRTIDTQVDDERIELNVGRSISNRTEIDRTSHISVISLNGQVLLVGQTPHRKYSEEVEHMVRQQDGVRHIYNEITIGDPIGYDVRSNDSWLTSKVKTMLIAEKHFDSSHVKVVTENSQVYLLGMVTHKEGDLAVQIARNVSGVTRVIRAFEYVDAGS